MPMKGSGASDPRFVDRFDGGLGWIAYPDEDMRRASHALATDAGVYVVDPVDADGIDEEIAGLGDVAGVVVALDRHLRDADAVANRHDVPVYVPHWMSGVRSDLDAPVEEFGGRLPDSEYEVIPVIKNPFWKEFALYDGDGGTLLVPEAVGTSDYFLGGDERLGVHPMLRMFPPRKQLGDCSPERVLVGHGEGIMADGAAALDAALRTARRNAPSAFVKMAGSFLPG